ncbi:coadhesin-like [Ostrea edulis]|uniref:coadhesin-like n=1 Tax=Ostrea edulis TaxID=37623 RepID=UPI0024AF9C26|nr:coadhesin-like [Ostrea edulis]
MPDRTVCLCPVHSSPSGSQLLEWGAWSECSATCESNGTRYRRRSCVGCCNNVPTETEICGLQACPVHGSWATWGQYSTCDKSCGGGWKIRYRKCNNPSPSNGGEPCYGDSVQPTKCAVTNCPVDGGWSAWSAYSMCSETCGQGVQIKLRTCTNPIPRYGGNGCVGSTNATRSCQLRECSVNGSWGHWSHFRPCDMSCGGGLQMRLRKCDNPAPLHGGLPCPGQVIQTKACNTQPCPDQMKSSLSPNVIG